MDGLLHDRSLQHRYLSRTLGFEGFFAVKVQHGKILKQIKSTFGVETELGCLSELGGRDVLFSDFTVMFDF